MEEIDMDNVVNERTRGREVDYTKVEQGADDLDEDDDDDEDFQDPDDEMKD